jgi:molybdopterin synthase sulfur carrier subunit
MKVNFYATLRQIAGHKTEEFSLHNGMTVQDLLDEVLERYPDMRPELMDEEGNLYRHVHLFVNGRDAYYLDNGMETPLQANDKINMFPAVGGG